MIGFRERTTEAQLRIWQRNLQINSDILTTQCKIKLQKDPTEREERKMVRDIKRNMVRDAKRKHARLISKLKPTKRAVTCMDDQTYYQTEFAHS